MEDKTASIHVENFKSLKDCTIDFKKFNVLIGVNGAGKTNVLELFKFVDLCVNSNGTPPYPFAPWQGFGNLVWSHDERLPIRLQFNYNVDNYDVEYKASISGLNDKLEFLEEKFDISNYLSVRRSFQNATYKFKEEFWNGHTSVLSKLSASKSNAFDSLLLKEPIALHQPNDVSILKNLSRLPFHVLLPPNADLMAMHVFAPSEPHVLTVLSPPVVNEHGISVPLCRSAANVLASDRQITFLRQLSYDNLWQSSSVNQQSNLGEDGRGLINLLFRWYTENSDRLPERFELALEALFPGWQIRFDLTDDGQVSLFVNEGGTDMYPSSIPDGFYKLLAILACIELEPRFLLIDQMEASLHAKMIEYLIDELKTCSSNVVLTTHSPTVIDLVEPEDLIILEKTDSHETSCRRVKDPEELKIKLMNKGITVSESWIYGKI